MNTFNSLRRYYNFEDLQQIWSTTFTHPYVIGVIDGTLIPVQKPPAAFHPDEGFLTRKHSR